VVPGEVCVSPQPEIVIEEKRTKVEADDDFVRACHRRGWNYFLEIRRGNKISTAKRMTVGMIVVTKHLLTHSLARSYGVVWVEHGLFRRIKHQHREPCATVPHLIFCLSNHVIAREPELRLKKQALTVILPVQHTL